MDRTATSQTFLLPDGSHETRIYQAPINYRDAPKEIGSRSATPLKNRPTARVSPTPPTASTYFPLPDRMGEGAVRLDTGEEWVSQELLGFDTALAEVEGTAATYTLGNEGVSFELASISSGVKADDRTRRCLSATRLQVQARHVRRGNPDPHEFGVNCLSGQRGEGRRRTAQGAVHGRQLRPAPGLDGRPLRTRPRWHRPLDSHRERRFRLAQRSWSGSGR